jgi:hypothetical protein
MSWIVLLAVASVAVVMVLGVGVAVLVYFLTRGKPGREADPEE